MPVDPKRLATAILAAFEQGEHAAVVDLVFALGHFASVASPLLLIGAISAHELGDQLLAEGWFVAGRSAIDDNDEARALLRKADEWIHEGRWSRDNRERLRGQAERWLPRQGNQGQGNRV